VNTVSVPLSHFARIFNGKTPSKADQRESGHPVLKIKDVDEDGVFRKQFNSYVEPCFAEKHSSKFIVSGDILILNAAHNADYVGSKVYRAENEVAGSLATGEWLIIRPQKDLLDPVFAYYWAISGETRFQIRQLVKGIHLYPRDVERLKIFLPPLEEQKRIAAILDKADAIRKKRKQAIELTEQFLRSAFLDMFGDPITNPKAWPTAIMKDCIADISSGWSAKSDDKVREPNDWAVLKISAVTSGRFLPSEHKVVSSIGSGRKLVVPKRGDLLFSRANTRELVAATCLVEADSERLFLPDKLWRLTVSNDMNPEYLRYLLAHPRYRSYLTRQATGTSGSMLNVSQQKLMGMKLPKPPIEVQQAFSDIVWKTYQLQATSNESAENMTAQFNGLTQRAFRGGL